MNWMAFQRPILASDMSDMLSSAQEASSRALVIQSRVSDIESQIDSGVTIGASSISDIRSAITAVTATVSASDISDIASAVKVILASDISDILSAAQEASSRALVVQSRVSDIESQIDSGVNMGASSLSDLRSAITVGPTSVTISTSDMSDIRSAIAAVSATVGASAISDIASAVKVILTSDLSDILSAAQEGSSRALVVQSRVSDIESQIDSGVTIGASSISDIRSAITAVSATVGASDISDIASAVKAILASDMSDILSAAQEGSSRALVIQSRVSDIESQIDSGVTIGASSISDLRSAITAGPTDVTIGASSLSDISSRVNVECADVMKTDTIAQLTSVAMPAAPTFEQAVMYLYQYLRNNRTQNASDITMYADDTSTAIAQATISDDGTTFTKGEFG
jgi:predicted PilT family ATPase